MAPTVRFIEDLLTSESVAIALDRVRRSGNDPKEVSTSLLELAREAAPTRPGTARLATFLADRFAELADVHQWIPQEHLSSAANDVLITASVQRTWPGTLAILRAHSARFSQEDMISVVAWHAELAQRGIPRRHNGIADHDLDALIHYLTSPVVDLTADDNWETAKSLFQYLLDQGNHLFAFVLAGRLARIDRGQGRAPSALATLDKALSRFAPIRALTPSAIAAELDAAAIESDDLGLPDAGLTRLRSAISRVEQRLGGLTVARDADDVLRTARPLYLALLERLLSGSGSMADDFAEAFDIQEASRPATWTAPTSPKTSIPSSSRTIS